MILSGLLNGRERASLERPRSVRPRATYRPAMDDLEGRLVLSHMGVAALAQVHHLHAPAHFARHIHPGPGVQANTSIPVTVTGLNLTGINVGANNALSAVGTVTGTLAGHPFTAPLTIAPAATPSMTGSAPTTGATPILNLTLGPIHLNLLGLKVDTSPICLSVSAQPGSGNLLGNLLTNVSNLLNGPNSSSLLGQLNGLVNSTVTNAAGTGTTGLLDLVNSAVGQALAPLGSVNSISPSSTTQILNLSVAPVDLNLLGLQVHLDNCSNGPITVSISAVPGSGNLLGNLLGGVAHLLDRPGNHGNALASDMSRIIGILDRATPV